ncbi:MAG TPA: hypothetical protein VFR31_18950 [Thermoanaerobaculia bacterium]|nr:hypothetical protein [Thermoanaerobaculia bacterium]
MATTITLNADVQVQSGPKASYALVDSVEAYGLTEVVIPKNGTDVEIPVVPAGPGQLRVLSITSDRYQDLKYKAKDSTGAKGTEVTLDSPQLFYAGTIALLGKTPHSLLFTNSSTTIDANVRILVGRKI